MKRTPTKEEKEIILDAVFTPLKAEVPLDSSAWLDALEAERKRFNSRLISCVPSTWLDDLLSGPNKVMLNEAGKWGCADIERLLNAVRERMVKATNKQIGEK